MTSRIRGGFIRGWRRRRWSSNGYMGMSDISIIMSLLSFVLKVALLVFASWFSVLEPVENIGITNLTIFLKFGSDLPYLVPWRINHSWIENCFKYPYLLWSWIPSWLWLWTSLFTSSSSSSYLNQQTRTIYPIRKETRKLTELYIGKM